MRNPASFEIPDRESGPTCPSRRTLAKRREAEVKCGARPGIAGCPYSAAMRFDDRPADRQAHAHAVGFGGEERVEQATGILRVDADARILYQDEHLASFVLAQPN